MEYQRLNYLKEFDVTLSAGKKNKFIKKLFALEYKKVKHTTLLGIALLIAGVFTLMRILIYFDITEVLTQKFTYASVPDIIARFLFHFLFSWTVLVFNARSKFKYAKLSKWLRTVITVLLNTIIFFGLSKLFFYLYDHFTGQIMPLPEQGLAYFTNLVVMLILIFVVGVLRYQIIHQQDLIEKESLKREKLKSELAALKNQINPHFLFNSLNSLNSLIIGNEKATSFVNKLSFMYRYILQSGQEDLVTVAEELKFLESYLFLIKTRYRDGFNTDIAIGDTYLSYKIPSLALQLLVENAVKHNEISESDPLLIKVYVKDDAITVENKIAPRTTFVDSTGNGLLNLNKRYQLLKNKKITITNANNYFVVKLPLN